MDKDRPLSDVRIRDIWDSNANPIDGKKELCKEQDKQTAKEVNAEWVKWIEENFHAYFTNGNESRIIRGGSIEEKTWQERKRSVL